MIIRDVTKGLDQKYRMDDIKVLIKIVDLDEEAEKIEAELASKNKGKRR